MPSAFPHAPNQFGVHVPGLDQNAPGFPDAQTYHGFFMVARNRIVGRMQSFQTSHYSRGGNHVMELNAFTAGHPVEYVPTVAQNFKCSFLHGEIWNGEMELALGFPAVFADLTDQTRSFNVEEWLQRGRELYRIWQYAGMWLNEKNREEYSVGGDYQVKVKGEASFVNVLQIF